MTFEEFSKKNQELVQNVMRTADLARVARHEHGEFLKETLGLDPNSEVGFDGILNLVCKVFDLKTEGMKNEKPQTIDPNHNAKPQTPVL